VGSEALTLPDGPFTLEAWVKPLQVNGVRALLGKTEASELGLVLMRGRPQLYLHVDGAYTTVTTPAEYRVTTGHWHHVASCFDGAEVRLYLDGHLVARQAAAGTRTTNQYPLYVGAEPDARGNPNLFFAGQLDEVRISTTARYGEEAFTPARPVAADEATALLLHLDATVGPFTLDASPRHHHPLAVGNVVYEPVTTGK
jgi:hypothetical protein